MRGKLITFEGPEGSGKSTQIVLAGRFLKQRGIKVRTVREPGGTPAGEAIRKILLNRRGLPVDPLTELFLYMAARTQLVHNDIQPALKRGQWVLCDRFLDASLCYQGYGHGLDLSFIRRLGREATQGIRPDLTLLLDIDIRTGLGRARGRSTSVDRIEAKSFAFHQRVRSGYRALARREPGRFRIISTRAPKEEVAEKIRKEVAYFFKKRLRAV